MSSASIIGPWLMTVRSHAKEMGLLGGIPLYSLASLIGILAGLAREVVVASSFGLSGDLDVLVAVMGFHLLFGVQVGNAIEQVFVSKLAPLHSSHVMPLVRRASLALVLVNAAVLSILVVVSRPVVGLIFPDFSMEQFDTGVRLIRLLLFPIACAGLAGILRGGLSVKGRFFPGFLAGTVVSVSTIVSVAAFADRFGIDALVWGFAAGHFLVLVWFAWTLGRSGLGLEGTHGLEGSVQVTDLWRPVAIVLIGELLYQAVVMTERSFASGLGVGKISAFFYAGSVMAVPLALFAAPVNTTLFPKLSRAFHASAREGRVLAIRYGSLLIGMTLLICVLLMLSAEPLIRIALVRGKFSVADAQLTAHILSILIWALPFASFYGIVRNSFYSMSDYRTPLIGYGIKWGGLLLVGNWLIPLYGVDGLAITSVVSQAAGTSVMGWLLQRRLADATVGV